MVTGSRRDGPLLSTRSDDDDDYLATATLTNKKRYLNNRPLCDLRYSVVSLLKALTTYNLHSATKLYKNYTDRNITSFAHKALIIN